MEAIYLLKLFVYWRLNCPKKWPEMTSCFIGFQNFPGEDPQPPFKIRKYVIFFFSIKLCSTQAFSLNWGFQTREYKKHK